MSSTSSLDKPSLAMDSTLRLFSAETQSCSVQDSLTRKKVQENLKRMANRLRLLGKGTAELQSPVAGFRERSWSCRHACKRRGKSCAAGFVRRRLRRCADSTRKEPMCDRCLRQTYCRIWVSRNRGHLCRSSRAVHVIEDLKDQETT